MSDGILQTPAAHPAPADASAPDVSVRGSGAAAALGRSDPSVGTAPERVHAPSPAYQHLAQQMQVFLNRTDLQAGRNNKYFLQQTLEMLSELDQHIAREAHLQAALLETQAQIVRVKQSLVGMAAESVDAEHDALSIAQARVHLAKLLHAKLLQEFN
jgi:hypothetical protein